MRRIDIGRRLRALGGFRSLFFLLAVGLGLCLHFYTQRVVKQLREESRSIVVFYAQMSARAAETESSEDISFLFNQIISRTNFPLIITDPKKNPVGWKGISIDPNDTTAAALIKVRKLVKQLDKDIDPVPVRYHKTLLNYLYYGDSKLIQELQWLPYVEFGILAVFLLLGFFGYANIRRGEERHIWVGMAKETAHQLGTPLSSLLGWQEILKTSERPEPEVLIEIEKDLNRLLRVTRRFSQIGSRPDLKRQNLAPIVKETAEYIRRRAPQLGRPVSVNLKLEDAPPVPVNPHLFEWALENLMKNALDAMDKAEGTIDIRLGQSADHKRVFVDIIDNGKGIERENLKRIFKPGFSTKSRGWGLGSSLAKRIVEEYHHGRLFVKESHPGTGTTIRIELEV
jgi:signal transduction histidine kinase